jgi:D-amino peptidase
VATKKGLGVYAARTVTPAKSRDLIRSGAKEAIVNIRRVKPYPVSKPVRMEVTFTRVIMAQYVSKIPGVERTGPKSVAYVAKDMLEGFDVFETMRMVAQVAGREGAL